MATTALKIRDFPLFLDTLEAVGKITQNVKLTFDGNGMKIYCKNTYARGEFTSTSVYCDGMKEGEECSFCTNDLSMLIRVLKTAADSMKENFEPLSNINMVIDEPFFRINNKKFKTKLTTCKEAIVQNNMSRPVQTELRTLFQFSTDSNTIRKINQNGFIFKDPAMARIYLETNHPEMDRNTIWARIDNDSNSLNNSITMKLGLINDMADDFEQGPDDKFVIDFDRLSLFNIVPDAGLIKIRLTDKNVLVYSCSLTRKTTAAKTKIQKKPVARANDSGVKTGDDAAVEALLGGGTETAETGSEEPSEQQFTFKSETVSTSDEHTNITLYTSLLAS